MGFVGREQELIQFDDFLKKDGAGNMLIYGRRRVGKSELVAEALRRADDCLAIQYVCRSAPFEFNLQGLSKAVKKAFNDEFVEFQSLERLLAYVYQQATARKVVFFIDEYPFLRDENPAVDSELQIAIDTYQHTSQLKLILCGSYMDVMKKVVMGEAPLFGRFQSIIKLKPFDYYDAARFCPKRTNEEKFLLYSVFGGMPFYLKMLDMELSPEENIEKLLIPEGSIMESEIKLQLAAELSKEAGANLLLNLIAQGAAKYADLLSSFPGKGSNRISYILDKLIGMELVSKASAVNMPTDKKKLKYHIDDNLIDFFYTFLFSEGSSRQNMPPHTFFARKISAALHDRYLPRKFEEVACEYLRRQSLAGNIEPPLESIGRYVYNDKKSHKNGEFDVVTKDSDGLWTSYECKYRQEPVSMAVVREEEWQIQDLGLDISRLGFFSRKGFTADIDPAKYHLITLDDLYL